MNQPSSDQRTIRWLYLIVTVLVIFTLSRIGYAIYQRNTTGTLHIKTSEPNAIISVSQKNKRAAFLGNGDVSARLKPGDYLVSATLAGDIATTTVRITAGQAVSKQMNPAHVKPPVSSSTTTGFVNFDALINAGLTSDQILDIQKLISQFNSKAQIVAIDATTVTPLPHDQTSLLFNLKFDFNIDKVPYHAMVTYVGFGAVELTLTDQSGAQVFHAFSDTGE